LDVANPFPTKNTIRKLLNKVRAKAQHQNNSVLAALNAFWQLTLHQTLSFVCHEVNKAFEIGMIHRHWQRLGRSM